MCDMMTLCPLLVRVSSAFKTCTIKFSFLLSLVKVFFPCRVYLLHLNTSFNRSVHNIWIMFATLGHNNLKLFDVCLLRVRATLTLLLLSKHGGSSWQVLFLLSP